VDQLPVEEHGVVPGTVAGHQVVGLALLPDDRAQRARLVEQEPGRAPVLRIGRHLRVAPERHAALARERVGRVEERLPVIAFRRETARQQPEDHLLLMLRGQPAQLGEHRPVDAQPVVGQVVALH
jgi:hypothetical protein